MDELVQRLSTGSHPVTVGGPQSSPEELKRRVEEIGTVFVKFTGTRGGTDLGLSADRAACDLSHADFGKGTGMVHIEGTLILNDEPIRCIADIDLATLNGTGHLVVVEESAVAS
jgi:Core binding factor beta subunit